MTPGTEAINARRTEPGRRGGPQKLWSAGLLAAGLSAGVNAVFYLLARAAGFVRDVPIEGEPIMTVGLGSVIAASVTAALLGTAVFAAVRKVFRHPVLVMGIVGGAVLLIASFVPYMLAPGGIAGISPCNCGVAAILVFMHGFTAIMTLGVLSNWSIHHAPTREPDIARAEPSEQAEM